MRLDRFIAHATGMSRRQVNQLIRGGRVLVDGLPAQGALRITEQTVSLDGQPVVSAAPVYLMLHKPIGYVCANTDALHPTVLDLLDGERFHPTDPLQIVGRLDADTSGLVLLTTDGHWNHRITAPASHCSKTYRVELEATLTPAAKADLEQGIWLKSETKPTLPCQILPLDATRVDIVLREGKYHQVKRMFAAVGNRVIALHRSSIGEVALDPALLPGQFRHLTRAEIDSLSV